MAKHWRRIRGLLVEGKWQDRWYDTSKSGGAFVRSQSQWRDWVTRDGAPAQGRQRGFKAEPGRYHLYVSLACPWAHRTLILRKLKKLEDIISVSVVHHFMGENGWTFKTEDGATGDTLYGCDFLHQIYTKADPAYSGRVTVPVLWDKRTQTIVNNESREILRGLAQLATQKYDLSPSPQVDEIIDKLYDDVNNGVYRAGFATSQGAYDEAVTRLFHGLEHWESTLGKQPFLAGQAFSEADICFFTTLVRFDPVYFIHFKCSHRRIVDYPNLWAYLRSIYQMQGVAETCNMDHIRHHYYESHRHINPCGIVARIPAAYLNSNHDRWQRFPQAIFPA